MPFVLHHEYLIEFIFFTLSTVLFLLAWYTVRCTNTLHPLKALMSMSVYYFCYLIFPVFIWSIFAFYQNELSQIQWISISIICLLIFYMRFIEPRKMKIAHHQIRLDPNQALEKPLKVAMIADLHVGLFSGDESQLRTIIKRINMQQPDFVVVAGDWTYEPRQQLVEELACLKDIQAPVYAVNGNHDEQYPGPPIQKLLADALDNANVETIEGKTIEMEEIRLLGVGDLWAGKSDLKMLHDLPQDKPWLILAHNPDTVDLVPKLENQYPLMLSGHTHGGQVALPWITSYVLKKVSMLGHKKGLYKHDTAQVFVSVGTGMVGVPFRFGVPPTIDIIYLV